MPSDVPEGLEQRILEQAQRLPPEGAVGGWASLRLHGVAYAGGAGLQVPLVVPPPRRLRSWPGGDVRREALPPEEVVLRHGVRCVHPVRAAVDEAARVDPRESVVLLDMVLAAGVATRTELAAYAARSRRPHVRQVRRSLTYVDDRSLSPGESWLRTVWLFDARLPRPRCNWPVHDAEGRFVGRPDLVCPELGTYGEYDGSEHRHHDRRATDLARADRFAALGLEGFTVVGRDRYDVGTVVARMHATVARARASSRPQTWRLAVNPAPP